MPARTELSVSLIDSKTKGVPTAVCRRADSREFYLHSRYDPLEEARFLVKDVPRRERTLYVVLGFGLGYHVKDLLQRVPQSSHVIVMEPNSACLSGRLLASGNRGWAWMNNSRLHFLTHHDPEVAPISLADRMATLKLLSLEMITHLPSTLTAESFYRALLAEIPREFPTCFNSRLNSLDKMLENHLQNFWSNIPHSWKAAPIHSLRGKWSDRKLVIVSAGPSLTQALAILREARSTAMLLATGTAVSILLSHQIRPDLAISIDPYEANLAHFQGWETADVPLIYHHQIYRAIPASYSGPKFYFIMQDDPPVPMSGSSEKSDFLQGGSVAFSALQLAHHLDANPIIFVGQDFAFADSHTHASGCIVDRAFDAKSLPGDYLMVPGVAGNQVITSRTYHSYLVYMQDYLLDYAKRKPGVKHINTSRIGARIRGMESLDLEKALAEGEESPQPSPEQILASAFEQSLRKPMEARKAALDQWTTELGRLLAQAEKIDDFGRLFFKFKATSLYAQARRGYDDVYYLFETKYRSESNALHAAFLNRFKEHLQFVLEELRNIRAAV